MCAGKSNYATNQRNNNGSTHTHTHTSTKREREKEKKNPLHQETERFFKLLVRPKIK